MPFLRRRGVVVVFFKISLDRFRVLIVYVSNGRPINFCPPSITLMQSSTGEIPIDCYLEAASERFLIFSSPCSTPLITGVGLYQFTKDPKIPFISKEYFT